MRPAFNEENLLKIKLKNINFSFFWTLFFGRNICFGVTQNWFNSVIWKKRNIFSWRWYLHESVVFNGKYNTYVSEWNLNRNFSKVLNFFISYIVSFISFSWNMKLGKLAQAWITLSLVGKYIKTILLLCINESTLDWLLEKLLNLIKIVSS